MTDAIKGGATQKSPPATKVSAESQNVRDRAVASTLRQAKRQIAIRREWDASPKGKKVADACHARTTVEWDPHDMWRLGDAGKSEVKARVFKALRDEGYNVQPSVSEGSNRLERVLDGRGGTFHIDWNMPADATEQNNTLCSGAKWESHRRGVQGRYQDDE